MGLTVSDLSCHRSAIPVLDRVSFTAGDGETIVLRGPNGAGKSTLLKVLSGLLPMSSGAVNLDGADLSSDPYTYGEKIAYAGHLDAIKPQLTVAENLRFWSALFCGASEARALDALDLAAIADRPAHACSAGQKRRLGLARLALVPRRLWLLDEPTVSLDTAAIARLMDLIRAHCASGGMAIIATHVDLGLPRVTTHRLEPVTVRPGRAQSDPFLEDLAL